MANSQMHIDPEKFAYQFLNSLNITVEPEKVDIEDASKEALAAYLSAYYLADRFNQSESQFFQADEAEAPRSSYQRILQELNKY